MNFGIIRIGHVINFIRKIVILRKHLNVKHSKNIVNNDFQYYFDIFEIPRNWPCIKFFILNKT